MFCNSIWIKNIELNDIELLRFTREIFGFGELPFLLNGTIKEHLTTSNQHYPESVAHIEEFEESLYVDDLITGDATIEEVQKIKETAKRVFSDQKFKLHKWHSNVKELDNFTSIRKLDIFFKKQGLKTKTSESKILGVFWNMNKDTSGVNYFQVPGELASKRGMVKFLAAIYNPVGIISTVILLAKDIYSEACNLKLSWKS